MWICRAFKVTSHTENHLTCHLYHIYVSFYYFDRIDRRFRKTNHGKHLSRYVKRLKSPCLEKLLPGRFYSQLSAWGVSQEQNNGKPTWKRHLTLKQWHQNYKGDYTAESCYSHCVFTACFRADSHHFSINPTCSKTHTLHWYSSTCYVMKLIKWKSPWYWLSNL